MAIKVWLLGGVMTDDHITPEIEPCWARKDLVDVPAMIQYSDTYIPDSNVHIYANNVGCNVTLIPYGEFSSHEEMEQDYYSKNTDNLYTKAYQTSVFAASDYIGHLLKDLDWVMPILQGPLKIEENYCYIQDLQEENKELVSLIDCSMIYSSVKMISSFISKLCEKRYLSKYEQYQLAYYQMILQAVEKPSCFLTNKTEIEIYTKIYETWSIAATIENATGNAKQAVMLFSFLSDYQSAHENELFSSFLTFFGIVVGLEAIYNLAVALIGGVSARFNTGFIIAIACILSAYSIVFSRKAWKKHLENREFQKKTSPTRIGIGKADAREKDKFYQLK